MISHRAALIEDMGVILADLCDITKSEIAATVADKMDTPTIGKTLFDTGPSEISFSDDSPLFIVGHYPIGVGVRSTWCLAGKATETLRGETLAAAAAQTERMLADCPGWKFMSVSYSMHPRRDLFFARMGFHKRADHGNKAVFELLPVAGSLLDS